MRPLTRFLLAFWLVIAGGVGSPEPCVADTPVTLHADSEIRRGTVKLSDLFNGVPDWTDRDIAQSPSSSKPAVYDAVLLEKLAAKYELDWHPKSASDHVTITSLCKRITSEAIRDAVVQKVKDAGAKGAIDVSFDNHTLEITLPADNSADFTLNNFGYDPLAKRFRADLVADGTQGPFSLPLSGRVVIKRHVPVLARRLEAGMVIGTADIDWADVPDDRVSDAVMTDAAQIVGHELRHSTPEGELLHENDVMPPRLVTRGALVTMRIETPFMTLTSQGRALQDGAQGETVRVTNTQSNRTIEGTVDASGNVIIRTGQKFAAVE